VIVRWNGPMLTLAGEHVRRPTAGGLAALLIGLALCSARDEVPGRSVRRTIGPRPF
jgi:hypothetical protein